MGKVKDLAQCKHPNSRKTNALLKQIKKTKTREKSKIFNNVKTNLLAEKIAWFRDNLEQDTLSYTAGQVTTIIEKYLSRFDDELEQIRIKHSIGQRKNRQHANKQDAINLIKKRELEEYRTCGLEMPDLLNTQQFNLLKNWQGEVRYLQNFKLKRYCEKHLQNEEKKHTKCTGTKLDEQKTTSQEGECQMEVEMPKP